MIKLKGWSRSANTGATGLLPKRSRPNLFQPISDADGKESLLGVGRKPWGITHFYKLIGNFPPNYEDIAPLLNSPQSLRGDHGRRVRRRAVLSQSAFAPATRGQSAGLALYALPASTPKRSPATAQEPGGAIEKHLLKHFICSQRKLH